MARIDLPNVPGLAAVIAALNGQVRLVGGVVRDTLAGVATKDIDLATPLAPEAVIAALKAAGLKAVPTGLAHGTVTAVAEGRPFEITTLRRDVATDGRHAEVAFTDDWREDAARRDFTINALYADPVTGEVFDYFGGLADLEACNALLKTICGFYGSSVFTRALAAAAQTRPAYLPARLVPMI
jgi:poly(A) polymerase